MNGQKLLTFQELTSENGKFYWLLRPENAAILDTVEEMYIAWLNQTGQYAKAIVSSEDDEQFTALFYAEHEAELLALKPVVKVQTAMRRAQTVVQSSKPAGTKWSRLNPFRIIDNVVSDKAMDIIVLGSYVGDIGANLFAGIKIFVEPIDPSKTLVILFVFGFVVAFSVLFSFSEYMMLRFRENKLTYAEAIKKLEANNKHKDAVSLKYHLDRAKNWERIFGLAIYINVLSTMAAIAMLIDPQEIVVWIAALFIAAFFTGLQSDHHGRRHMEAHTGA